MDDINYVAYSHCRCRGRVAERRGPRTNGRGSIPSPPVTNIVCLSLSEQDSNNAYGVNHEIF